MNIPLILSLIFTANVTDTSYQYCDDFQYKTTLSKQFGVRSDTNMPIYLDTYFELNGRLLYNDANDFILKLDSMNFNVKTWNCTSDESWGGAYSILDETYYSCELNIPSFYSDTLDNISNVYFDFTFSYDDFSYSVNIYNDGVTIDGFTKSFNFYAINYASFDRFVLDSGNLINQINERIVTRTGVGLDWQDGYNEGSEDGYSQGYTDGYNEGSNTDENVTSIFGGILNIGMLPVNFFLAIFNYEILGINLTAVISAILSICVAIIVIRFIKGGN